MAEPREFSQWQRTLLYHAADGKCDRCGTELGPDWHADHKVPWSRGGPTKVVNGQALCPPCNLKKGRQLPDGTLWYAPKPVGMNITLAKRRRRELGLTFAQVGELVGVGRDVVQRWEAGSREPRNAESLRRYAAALQCEPGELVAEPEPEAVGG